MERIDSLLLELKNKGTLFGDIKFKCCQIFTTTKRINIELITNKTIPIDEREILISSIEREIGKDFNIEINQKISIADEGVTKREIFKYLSLNYPMFSAFLVEDKIQVVNEDGVLGYTISYPMSIFGTFNEEEVIYSLNNYLSRNYSNEFTGDFLMVDEKIKVSLDSKTKIESSYVCKRYFTFNDVSKYCDSDVYNEAIYIEDGKNMLGPVIFAGYITRIDKITSKNGREYYNIAINDMTGEVEGRFFTRDKNKLKKIAKLAVGSSIIIRGENEVYNDTISLIIRGINLCLFEKDLVLQKKPFREVPKYYHVVNPQKAEVLKQASLFEEYVGPPKNLLSKVYVVLDLETTGLNKLEDNITEIGAIKIIEGRIEEEFHTLVNPLKPIPEEVVQKTGITDEMVKDSPNIETVFPDLIKYIDGATIVCHNADFDCSFIKRIAEKDNYEFNHEILDTVDISRRLVKGLKNYKLNTVCDYFKISFHHHRALSDAYATAELFIELAKIEEQKEN